MRHLLFALGMCLTSFATAQNFQDFNPMRKLSLRGIELLQRIRDKRLIPDELLTTTNPGQELDAIAACDEFLSLVSLLLGYGNTSQDPSRLKGWVVDLPLVEAFLAEAYGGKDALPKDILANIASIRARAPLHFLRINESAYQRFADVPKGHWADQAIHRMRETGILIGYPDSTFKGDSRS